MNQHAAAPEFAMSFTQEAVLLEHRDGRDWRPLGQVRFSGRDMTETLNALRHDVTRAAGDDEGAASAAPDTLLVIPDDQILYTTLTVPVGADTVSLISRALESMTPYAAADLAFDWCPSESGDIETLRVAAVARRTLEEAEGFARAQGFRPAGFVARPGDARFDGSPDFGPSRLAGEYAARPAVGEPDLIRARVTAPAIEEAATAEASPSAPDPAFTISRIVPHHLVRADVAAAVADPLPVNDAGTGAEIGAETSAAAVDAAPAARTAPAVIRHDGQKGSPKVPPLSPRAEAVRSRAAEARARRPAEDEPAPQKAPDLIAQLRGLNPGRLSVMMAVLVIGLLAVLMLFGGADPDRPQLAGREPAEPTQTSPAPSPAETAADPAPEPRIAEPQVEPAQPTAEAVTQAPESTPAPEPDDPTTAQRDPADGPDGGPQDLVAQDEATPAPDADALTRALAEAIGIEAPSAEAIPTATVAPAEPTAARAATSEAEAQLNQTARSAPTTAGAVVAPAPPAATATASLRSSARPQSAAPVRTATPAAPDASPSIPTNPAPFAQRGEAEPPRVAATRPTERPARRPAEPQADQPASAPAPVSAAAPPATAPQPLESSPRPRARPDSLTLLEEGSASEDSAPTRLTEAERGFLEGLLHDLRTAETGAAGLRPEERAVLIRLADARPLRKPVAVSRPSDQAVRAAVAAAVAAERPTARSSTEAPPPTAGPASQAGLHRSSRPATRPAALARRAGADPGAGNPSLSSAAVEDAIAAAVANSTALPGAVALTALSTSALPPRRSGARAGAAAQPAATPQAPSAADLRAAAEAQRQEEGLAEQRRMDAELQAQAEARARAQAAADAQAEARARAQAEARARAQAEAEARAAASRKQSYTPPEAEKEPDVAVKIPAGRGQGAAAATATVKDGIQLSRTQIIGTIGAGKASRALVRLSNGRVITLRLGDRINGGTITDIGNSRITYVKGGRPQELSVLNGQ